MPHQHGVQEADQRHDGVVEELVEAPDASHLPPKHKQLPVGRTATPQGGGGGTNKGEVYHDGHF